MAGEAPLPWTGENLTLKLFLNNVPLPGASALIKSMKVDEDAVIHEDDYSGQTRTRYDKQIKGYSVQIEMDTASLAFIKGIQDRDAKREANQAIPELGFSGVGVNRNTGESVGFFLSGVEGKWSFDMSGRTERVKTTLDLKASRFNQLV